MIKSFLILIIICPLIVKNQECGVKKVSNPTPLLVGGMNTYPGQFPWLASLFFKVNDKFYCGASVISQRHLLTGEFTTILQSLIKLI